MHRSCVNSGSTRIDILGDGLLWDLFGCGSAALCFPAHWSGLVLPAGEYAFSIDNMSPSGKIVVRHDGKIVGLVMLGLVASYNFDGNSELDAVPAGETYRISSLHVRDVGVVNFPSRSKERKLPEAEFGLSAHISITGSGK